MGMSEHWSYRLRQKLEEMRLYDGTGDPFDNGYQEAIGELEDWLSTQCDAGLAKDGARDR
jgi:hypothetical protein